jgi:hypothetical protein
MLIEINRSRPDETLESGPAAPSRHQPARLCDTGPQSTPAIATMTINDPEETPDNPLATRPRHHTGTGTVGNTPPVLCLKFSDTGSP